MTLKVVKKGSKKIADLAGRACCWVIDSDFYADPTIDKK